MDLSQFLTQRRSRWQRLTDLLDRVDTVGLGGLSPGETDELFSLYRLVSSDLNLAQTRTGNPTILEYLEGLVGRAYANLSVPRKASFFGGWWRVLRHYFPATLRREYRLLMASTLIMVAGMMFGFLMTEFSPRTAEVFLPAEQLEQTPRERVAMLEEMERNGQTRVSTPGQHSEFSTFLFTHNIRVTVLAFALGLTFGIGTAVMLFYNGVMLGSLAVLYLNDGVMMFFLGWVGPHGSIELPCIIFGGTAGLMMARAQFKRDEGPTLAQLRELRPALVDVLVGTASLLVIAGLIESGFSQINEPTIPYIVKIGVAVVLFALLIGYLTLLPAEERPRTDEDQLVAMVEE